ncbi:hypothetical protein HpVH107_14030 [Helicobacter pylori]|nr:hypothetical protein VN1261_13700 [Helicobacter pylori]
MKTIRNSVFIGASLLGGCTSVETYFDALPKDLDSPYRTD